MKAQGFLKIKLPPGRTYGLDIMRSAAILLVVYAHGFIYAPDQLLYYYNLPVLDGVTLFFVLSGFLVGRILITTLEKQGAGLRTLGNFWKRRWLRTLPNYFFMLTLVSILAFIFPNFFPEFKAEELKYYYTFTQNLYTLHPDFFGEAWSLSVEEWFYILYPVLLFLVIGIFRVNTKWTILTIAITLIIAVMIFRYIRAMSPILETQNWDQAFRKQVVTRLDSILFGVIGAWLLVYKKEVFYSFKKVLFVLGIILLFLPKFIPLHESYIYYTVFYMAVDSIAGLLLIPLLNSIRTGNGWVYRLVTLISIISYSMYLLHFTFVRKFVDLVKMNFFFLTGEINGPVLRVCYYILYWGLTILFAIVLYKLIEKPFMDLREKRKVSG